MNQVPQIEVEQVEAIAGLAHKHQRTPAECVGQAVFSCQPQDDAAEERHQQAVVHDCVGNMRRQRQKQKRTGKTTQPEHQAQTAHPIDQFIQLGQQNAKNKAGQMGQRRVFERL